MPAQLEQLLLVSGCGGHADRNRPIVGAAGFCSYLSDCMSLLAHHYLLRAHLPARLGCQGGLDRYAAEPAARSNAPATSADTETGMALRVRRWPRVRMRCCSRRNRSTSGLLLRTNYMHCVHHMQGGADDVTELLMAALTASARANRPWQRRQLLHVRRGALAAADLEPMAQPAASQLLWS